MILYPNGAADPMGATAWHNAGYTGDGVRVGVIDGGYVGFTTRLAPHLKTPAVFNCWPASPILGQEPPGPTFNSSDCERDINHGTKVVDQLLGVAPDVSLYLANYDSSNDNHAFSKTVEWMIAHGVQVINFSAAAVWSGPGDGTSVFQDS